MTNRHTKKIIFVTKSQQLNRNNKNYSQEIEEVLLSWNEPISAIGAAKQAGADAWHAIPARKLLQAGKQLADQRGDPGPFAAIYRALQARNEKLRGTPNFLKGV